MELLRRKNEILFVMTMLQSIGKSDKNKVDMAALLKAGLGGKKLDPQSQPS